jgi:hypothetical protein
MTFPEQGAVQLGAAPDFEPRVAASRVRNHFACGSKPEAQKGQRSPPT